MDILELINNYGYLAPLHGKSYVNHAPMSQYCLYKLGADEKTIIDRSNLYIKTRNIKSNLSENVL